MLSRVIDLQKPKVEKSNKPPTEEERAALRAIKEQEKKAKAEAKASGNALTPETVAQRSEDAAAHTPSVASGSGRAPAVSTSAFFSCLRSFAITAERRSFQVVTTSLPKLKMVARGKIRDIYALPDEKDSDKLLFIASDRISAFDFIMANVRLVMVFSHQATPDTTKTDILFPGHSPEGRHPLDAFIVLVPQVSAHHSQPRFGPLAKFRDGSTESDRRSEICLGGVPESP